MYRLYELINTKWIDVLDVETLMDIKTAILSESKKEEVSHFRIDHDDVPITFCGTDEFDIEGCFDSIERIDEAAMYMHQSSEKYLKKVTASRPSKYKEVKIPEKTTKKHKKKIIRSNVRRRSYH